MLKENLIWLMSVVKHWQKLTLVVTAYAPKLNSNTLKTGFSSAVR